MDRTERPSRKLVVELAARTPGADGIELRADIHRPADGRPVPVVLVRSGGQRAERRTGRPTTGDGPGLA